MLVLASAEDVAFITGGATVLAALILGGFAARAADQRLTKQIKDAGDRQESELAHDRELADLDDLRKLLDTTAVALNGAIPSELVDFRLTLPEPRSEFKARVNKNATSLDALHTRLSIRLGPRDVITLALGGAIESLRAIDEQIPRGEVALDQEAIKARADIMTRALHHLEARAAEFVEAAVERAGTVATQGGSASTPE